MVTATTSLSALSHHRLPLPYHEMKKQLLALKSRVSSSNRKKRDRLSPVLDKARTVCQLLSNLGSGGINVPGLQAAGLVAVQIIDIIKVWKLLFEQRSVDETFHRKQKATRPIVKTLSHASCSSWIRLGRHSEIRAQRTSIYVSRRILNDSPSMFRVHVIVAYLRCFKGTWRRFATS
jgi:hypothetical protein